MESINIGLGFDDVVMKRTLIDKLGVTRYLQVTKEAMARGTVPDIKGHTTRFWVVLNYNYDPRSWSEKVNRSVEWTLILIVDTDYTCILICWSLLKLYLELIKEQLFLKFSFTEKKNSLLREVQARVSMRVYKLINECCVLF